MAEIYPIDQKEFNEWLAGRPKIIESVATRHPPNRLYRLRTTDHRVTVFSYSEDGTITVAITGQYNLLKFPRRVFCIDPDDLYECELPADDEPLGTTQDPDDTFKMINGFRADHGKEPMTRKEFDEFDME